MSFKSLIPFLTIFLMVLFVPLCTNSITFQDNPLAKAIQLFDKGKFEEAEPLFKKLIDERPDDFMINYFYGASRTKNGHFSNKDLYHLEKASKEVTPVDIDYYFGLQYQAQKNWEKALKHYNKYGKTASKEDIEKTKLAEKIQQCYDNINPYEFEVTSEEIVSAAAAGVSEFENNSNSVASESGEKISSVEKNELVIPAAAAVESNSVFSADSTNQKPEIFENIDSLAAKEEPKTESIKEVPSEPNINFSINSEITYAYISQFQTSEGKELFETAAEKQNELDRTIKTLDFLREKYVSTYSRKEKDSIGNQILELENFSYELKNETNQILLESKAVENEYWQNASEEELSKFIENSKKIKEKPASTKKPVDSNNVNKKVIIPDILVEDTGMESTSTEPTKSDLIYKIQIGAFSRGIPSYRKKLFDNLALIRKIENYTDEKGVVVYTTGNLTRLEDALVMQKQVQQEGVEDAFIVPYLNGKRITLEQAKEIEGIK